MARQFFGTDGVRGTVGESPITPDFVLRLGQAAGRVFARHSKSPHATVLIGKDTRVSGYMLEAALQAGFSAAGVDIVLCGPIPTPAVAYLTRALRLDAGVVISASHNPYQDNGIKFFSAAGTKLPDAVEEEIEAEIAQGFACVTSDALGKARRLDDACGRYVEFCKITFPNGLDLKGMKLYLDCAHGAAYHAAPAVFHELGADVVCETFDVRDDAKLIDWIDCVVGDGDLDVLLINQGVSASAQTTEKGLMPEATADMLREIDVNARADLLAVNEAVRKMIERKTPGHHFQVGMVSSMASFTGLPSSPGYSASKACVRVFGQAMRRLVAEHNIGVTVICPGFVVSPMSERFVGGKPLMVTADVAAHRIREAMDANRATCVFPKILVAIIFLISLVCAVLARTSVQRTL